MNRSGVVVALALLGACRDSKTTPITQPPPSSARPPAAAPDAALSPIPAATQQLLVGITDDWASTRATLRLFTRDGDSWRPSGPAWSAVVGRNGLAWGSGLHETPPESPIKHEGDGKAPAGLFRLRGAYGYADAAPDGTRLPYAPSASLQCVDDPTSPHYAQIVDGKRVEHDWASAEKMRRDDALYTWVIDIAHNASRTSGDGSCIFFHVWSGPDSTTSGCTAMPQPALEGLLEKIDPALDPVYVLLPRSEYERVRDAWLLPR